MGKKLFVCAIKANKEKATKKINKAARNTPEIERAKIERNIKDQRSICSIYPEYSQSVHQPCAIP